ncbi:lytic transglycosylase domain-containing protein [Parasphingorhabdus sp.]|uniref:lytic transglycosylase domain-containing protein n=1 Tax=Parasphingorhabdus sp. TaxID=2709688 RepID=UPI003D26E1AA
MLRTLIFAAFLALSETVAAQDSAAGGLGGSESQDLETTVQSEETGDFKLFRHGIWPHAQAPDNVSVQALATAIPQRVSKQRKPKPVSRKTAARRMTYLPYIREAERRHRLPYGLLDALIWAESRYNPVALSRAGAAGLTQLMPDTAANLGVSNRYDPAANIDGGARYLRQMLDRFGLIHLALAAYNAGPNAVHKAKGIPRYRETQNYVKSVLARWTESYS